MKFVIALTLLLVIACGGNHRASSSDARATSHMRAESDTSQSIHAQANPPVEGPFDIWYELQPNVFVRVGADTLDVIADGRIVRRAAVHTRHRQGDEWVIETSEYNLRIRHRDDDSLEWCDQRDQCVALRRTDRTDELDALVIDSLPAAVPESAAEFIARVEDGVTHGNENDFRALCTEDFWVRPGDSGLRLYQQMSRRGLHFRLMSIEECGDRAIATLTVVQGNRDVDLMYAYLIRIERSWLLDRADEREDNARAFVADCGER